MSDEDERLHKPLGESRRSRRSQDRDTTENRTMTDSSRLEAFRSQFRQAVLPNLPDIPGWHLCWVSTTHTSDSVWDRQRLGYELVKPEDIPGWKHLELKDGDHAGNVGVREMIAMKIPQDLYQAYMEEVHHNAPASEDERLSNDFAKLREQIGVGRAAAASEEDDGMVGNSKPKSRPVFS